MKLIEEFDSTVINLFTRIKTPFARIALFLVYFWFGILKLFDSSPANPLVEDLLSKTMPFIGFKEFIIFLGIVEIFIGIGFLFPKLTRLVLAVLLLHMTTTIMPLVLLPQIAWKSFMVPTLEGQYIIKNILIIALGIAIGSRLTPFKKK